MFPNRQATYAYEPESLTISMQAGTIAVFLVQS